MAAPFAYLDECVDPWLVGALNDRGFRTTAALLQDMLTKTDEEQLQYAVDRGFVLITHNKRDFVRLHNRWRASGRGLADVIAVPGTSGPTQLLTRVAMLLLWLGDMPPHAPRVFSWGDLQYALTQGLRLDGFSDDEVRLALGQAE